MKSSHLRPLTKTKSGSILTLKPSDFQPASKNQVKFHHPYKTNSIYPHQTLKPSNFRPRHQDELNFSPYNQVKLSSIPHDEIKSFWTTHTKTKSSSMITLKTSDLQPASKTKSISTTRTKPTQSFRTLITIHFRPQHKNQVNFDPHGKKQVNFDPKKKIV